MNSCITCSQNPSNAVEVSLASCLWKSPRKGNNTKYLSSREAGEQCCYTGITCNSPYDGFCLNKDIGPPSQCLSGNYVEYESQTYPSFPELIAFLSAGCSHVKGSSSVQCCLRTKASQPGGASDSPQIAPVPDINLEQPLPQSSLPIDYEQAAQAVGGPTDSELAAIPELTQLSLPDAGFVPGRFSDSYSWT